MLGVILIGAWMAFVAGYLIWQQVSGDLADGAISSQPIALSRQPSALSAEGVAGSLTGPDDPRDVRRSLVYRPTSFSASAGGAGAES